MNQPNGFCSLAPYWRRLATTLAVLHLPSAFSLR